MKKLRILLADDHKIVREGLRLLINRQPDMLVVAQATIRNDPTVAINIARRLLKAFDEEYLKLKILTCMLPE